MPLLGAYMVPHPPLIIPKVGNGQQKKIQKTIDAYEDVARRIALIEPDTIIVITPHSTLYSDYYHISPGANASGSFKDFGAEQVTTTVEYDTGLAESIVSFCVIEKIHAGFKGERHKALDHATLVPLYFIKKQYTNFKIVRISLSGMPYLNHYQFGKCIKAAIDKTNRKTVVVASGDLSHKLLDDGPYGRTKEGPIFDSELTQALRTADFLKLLSFNEDFSDAAAECGLRSFIILSGILDGLAVKPELLSYEGPFGVGYAVAAFDIIGTDDQRHFDRIYQKIESSRLDGIKQSEDAFVQLARQSLECFIRANHALKRPEDLPASLIEKRAGVFVSLKLDGRLRGCIGTISPITACIADEIIQNAISAGTQDFRFERVLEDELDQLIYSVDVLSPSEPIASFKELDAERYGVIVRYKGRSGLLLPNLEGIDSPDKQVEIALQKAGISKDDPYAMERFEVVRHH
jgi:MEMO1 family protein